MANPLAGHTNSYHTYSHDQALQGIAEAGYTAVELSAVPGWTEHVDLDADQGELRRKLEGYGLDPVSLSAHSDLTTAEGLAHGIKAVRWAAEYGIPIVNTAVGGHQSADENEAAFLANIGAMADEAEQAGIAIGLEIHGDIMASGAVTLPLLEKIGRDSVGINYDTANVVYYSGDTPVDDLPKVVDKLVHVHLKESKGGKGVWNFGEIGTGDVDFARVLRILQRRGLRRALLGRDRVQRRAVATARRGERRDARVAGAPRTGSAWDEALHAGDDEPPGARVPGGRRPHRPRAGRLDRGSRRPWAALDGRLHPARGVQTRRRGARRARRPAGPVRPRARSPRRERDHLRPALDVRLAAAGHLRHRSPRRASSGSRSSTVTT